MESDEKTKEHVPWYRRGTALITTVGAIAAAAASVVGLWDRFAPQENTEDVATVEVVEEGRPLALRDFVTQSLGGFLTLEPDSQGAPAHPATNDGAARAALAVAPSIPPTPAVPEISPVPSDPGEPTGSADTGTGESGDPSESSIGPESPSTTPPGTVTEEVLEDTARDVGGLLFNDPGYFEPSDMRIFLQAAPSRDAPPADPAAQQSFKEAVARTSSGDAAPLIVDALSVVEGTYDANPEPRGWVIPVQLSFEKLSGDSLFLTWSLQGLDVPQSWSGDKLAYKLQEETDHASSSAEIWVPDLTVPGTYQLTVKLVKETDRDLVIAEDSSGLLNR